jgi:LPS export ABC transporter permease LptG/LPS export ABC transporter permease LptF
MFRTIDRYIFREALAPCGLALLIFTFVLQIPPVMQQAEALIAKGVPWRTIGLILATLLPQALGITIPMAVLIGLLMALGRLSGDRETVALQACGVSIYRIARPLVVLSLIAWAATSWILIKAMPEANQMFREITYNIVASRAENDVRPRVFFEDFPNLVLYAQEVPGSSAGWRHVFLADLRAPAHPVAFVATEGRMVVDRARQKVDVELRHGAVHRTTPDRPDGYEVERFETMTIALDPETVFKRSGLQRGINEMTIADLRGLAATMQADGAPNHAPVIALHRKFAIPVACFVFMLIALGLGVTSRKDVKQASFVTGIAVIFVYYVFMYMAEAMAKGRLLPAPLAAWFPNVVLGAAGVALVWWRSQSVERRMTVPRPGWLSRQPAASEGQAGRLAGWSVAGRSRGRTAASWRWPGPTTLDRYIGRMYLRVFVLAFVGLLGIFYISTFIDLSDKLFKGQTTGWMLLRYLGFATPQFVYYVLPISALVSTLVTIGLLTKSSELVVMRACGISLYRSAAPLLVFALVGSAALFGLEETILAPANREAQALSRAIRGGAPRTVDTLNRRWLVGRDGAIYHYQFYDVDKMELSGLSVYHVDPASWELRGRTYARTARATDGTWLATEGWMRAFDAEEAEGRYATFDTRQLELEPADSFAVEQPDADRMNFRQLRAYVRELEASGFNVVPHLVALQRKVSFPFVTLIMTLIAVPFAVTTGRRGALYGVGVGIVLAITYWLVFSVCAAIGSAGLMSPLLAAWLPNVLFGAAGVYLLLTVRT